MEKYDLSLLASSDFENCKGQNYSLALSSGQQLMLQLVQVTAFKNYSPLARTPFSLVFQSIGIPAGLPQGIYMLEDPKGISMEVFLVPIGPDPNGMKYEAVFS